MEVEEFLQKMNISFTLINHEPVYTVSEAQILKEKIAGIGVKNLFLTDKKGNYYIYMIEENKKADFKYLKQIIGTNLKFASEAELYRKTKLTPGSVTPFGILNDNGSIKILFDEDLVNINVLVHPNINTKTLSINSKDLFEIFDKLGNTVIMI